jgi:hypothetical protein
VQPELPVLAGKAPAAAKPSCQVGVTGSIMI